MDRERIAAIRGWLEGEFSLSEEATKRVVRDLLKEIAKLRKVWK